jgi:hypothetical protein
MNGRPAALGVAGDGTVCYATRAVRRAYGRTMEAGPSTVMRRSRDPEPGPLETARPNRHVWYLHAELEQGRLSSKGMDIVNTR